MVLCLIVGCRNKSGWDLGFVHTYTQSEEFNYPFNTPNIQPPFDRWEFQNDNVKVNFYTGLPSTAWKLKFDSILF